MESAAHLGDDELLRLAKAGDQEAFTALYRRRQGAIYRFAMHMSGRAAVAEEVTQEVFLTLLREPDRYQPEQGELAPFLYGIARHRVLRCLEREARFEPMAAEPPSTGPDPLAELARGDQLQSLRRAVLALPTRYREVVVLCDLEELDYVAAATTLGCAVGTVRSRLHRARGLLAAKLRRGGVSRCFV